MSGLIDLHAHILPGIDDGPTDLDAALAMLRAAAETGTTVIAATPHVRPDFPNVHIHEISERCEQLREAAIKAEVDIRIVPGAEVSLVWAFEASDEELTLASYQQRGNDLLVETSSMSAAMFDMMLFGIRARGFRIVLAHVERIPEFQRDPARLEALAEQGVLLQVNADALLARPRSSPGARVGRRLCTDGLVHVLASDGHRAFAWRPVTQLREGAEAAAALVGPERARWMTESVPAAILEGSQLPEPPPTVTTRRRPSLRDLIPTRST